MPKIEGNCHYCHFRMPINRAFVTVVAVVDGYIKHYEESNSLSLDFAKEELLGDLPF
jgi:hypothetical protein